MLQEVGMWIHHRDKYFSVSRKTTTEVVETFQID